MKVSKKAVEKMLKRVESQLQAMKAEQGNTYFEREAQLNCLIPLKEKHIEELKQRLG
jgi:hypothetical protein